MLYAMRYIIRDTNYYFILYLATRNLHLITHYLSLITVFYFDAIRDTISLPVY